MCEYCENGKNIELASDSAISHWFIIRRNGVARLYCKMGEGQTGNAYGIKINNCPICGEKLARYRTMTKQELMESYTMEQIADMIVERDRKLEAIILDKTFGASHEDEGMLDRLSEETRNLRGEIDNMKSALDRKQTEINQIDEILEKLFGVTHDIAKPGEFEIILREKAENYKTIPDFLTVEPIKVADMLIDLSLKTGGIISDGKCIGEFSKKVFDISELRQIAQHLLVYCNVNESEVNK